MDRIPCTKCGAMILPNTAKATGGICMPCKKNPGGNTFGAGIGKLGDLGAFLAGKMEMPMGNRTEWLELCALDISTGKLWIGDPLLANEEDGLVTAVPKGKYVVEGIGCLVDGTRTVFSVRARLRDISGFHLGERLGETGTDCGMIGICDIGAFDAACGDAEDVQMQLQQKTWKAGFGCIDFKRYHGAVMSFVPSGDGDGNGAVYGLVLSGQRVGIQHDFYPQA